MFQNGNFIEMDMNDTNECGVVLSTLHHGSRSDEVVVSNLVVSLPIMSAGYQIDDTLLDLMKRNKGVTRMLMVTGNYWCADSAFIHKFYFLFVRIVLVAFCIFWLIVLFLVPADVSSTVYSVAFIISAGSLLPAQYYNQCRLNRNAMMQDSLVFDESCSVAANFGWCCFATVVVAFVILSQLGYQNLFMGIATSVEIFICAYLAFNLFLLLMDLKVSSLLLDQLFLLVDSKEITMEKFDLVRTDIHRRVQESKLVTDLILIPCLLCGLSIVLVVFANNVGAEAFTALLLFQIKEFFFVLVAFWYVADVNEKADELTRKLSAKIWNPASVTVQDLQRLSTHASAVSNPISFTLLFERLNRYKVFLSIFTYFVTLVAGLIKTAIEA